MIDELIARALRVWRENKGLLIAVGILSWLIPIAFSFLLAVIASLFGISDPANIPYWAVIITFVASSALMNAVAINGNYAVRKRVGDVKDITRRAFEHSLETATAVLFTAFPAITGALLAMVVITLLGEAWAWLATILFIIGVLGSILVTLMPYYAAEHGWQNAMQHAIDTGKKIYITLLLLNLFFGLIYITIVLPFDPETASFILIAVDTLFLMHLRHQTFFEVLDSVSGRE